MEQRNDYELAGRLIQWGLQPQARPHAVQEYRRLVDRYRASSAFQAVVRDFADGLGLRILRGDDYGLLLVPKPGSVFRLDPSDYRASGLADERLLDGLAMVAVLGALFPRPEDIEDDPTLALPPVTADEVDDVLRHLAAAIERRKKERGELKDPTLQEVEQGLEEAWRVYADRVATSKSGGERASSRTTRRKIERALDFMAGRGLFVREEQPGGENAYRATYRLRAMAQDYSTSRIARTVRDLLDGTGGDEPTELPEPSFAAAPAPEATAGGADDPAGPDEAPESPQNPTLFDVPRE